MLGVKSLTVLGSILSLLNTVCGWLSWPECHQRGMCVGHGLLSSAIFADRCSAYSGRRSQHCFWGYVREHLGGNCPEQHALLCERAGGKQPPLVKEKADFDRESSPCPNEGGVQIHSPLSSTMLSSLFHRVSPCVQVFS